MTKKNDINRFAPTRREILALGAATALSTPFISRPGRR